VVPSDEIADTSERGGRLSTDELPRAAVFVERVLPGDGDRDEHQADERAGCTRRGHEEVVDGIGDHRSDSTARVASSSVPADLMRLPKAELHLHVEGTLEPELAFALAARNGVTPPAATPAELAERYAFEDLQSFLDLYYACMAVLLTREDFRDLAAAYFARAAAQGVRHVELFFDPQAHLVRGVRFDDVVDGLQDACRDARERFGISSSLVMCFLRDRPASEALEVLAMAVARRDRDAALPADEAPLDGRIIGVGLDSAEVGNPASGFRTVFAAARAAGLRAVAHAGEEGAASTVTDTLDELRVARIDHGIRAASDPAVVARLVAEGVPLTVCPLSNLRLRAVSSLDAHPILALLDAGVRVTVNSDDPAYFGGYVGDNFIALREHLGMTDAQAAAMAEHSIRAAFLDDARRDALLAELTAWRTESGLA
jgi:adenosine deaminase